MYCGGMHAAPPHAKGWHCEQVVVHERATASGVLLPIGRIETQGLPQVLRQYPTPPSALM
jgi:hypothetical protein